MQRVKIMRVKPKKKLGQNFLIDKNIQAKIMDACAFGPADSVLEIGAGRGELTRSIAQAGARVYALEIDASLCSLLRNTLQGFRNVTVIHADVLDFDPRNDLKGLSTKLKVIGNIPYYITSPIIGHMLGYRMMIEVMFFTVQKEFAERLAALPGSKAYGSLSCFAQYYTRPQILFTIKRNSFFPAPNVDSSFLRLDIKEKPVPLAPDEAALFIVIRAAFNQRRKTLKNSLRGFIEPRDLEQFCSVYQVPKNTRPEDLSLSDFINLSKYLKKP